MNTGLLKELLPPALLNFIKGRFYGWSGNYASWEDAKQNSDGYDLDFIFEKVKNATRQVISGDSKYERDGITFSDAVYNYQLLTALSFARTNETDLLHVIDFGGSLGSLYWQHRNFLLPRLVSTWNVVEQEHFVKSGKAEFANEKLNFYYDVDTCMAAAPVKFMVLSSVLQYLPDPWALLDSIIQKKISWLFIDRTAFNEGNADRLTIQKVHPSIYKATYPCWFLSDTRFREKLLPHYEIVFEFDALDNSNLSETKFKGMFLRLKK